MLEGERLRRALLHRRDRQRLRVGKCSRSANVADLTVLLNLSKTAGHLLYDFVFERSKLVEIDVWIRECHAPRRRVLRIADQFRDVQQCFGRNASAIQAHAARIRFGIDECDVHAKIRRVKRRGVAARTGAYDN